MTGYGQEQNDLDYQFYTKSLKKILMKILFWHFSSGFLLNDHILHNNCIILDVNS